jgi:adenine-specific DNA-methyltransferase
MIKELSSMARKNKYTDWTKEELIKRVTALDKRKKYGLVWEEEKTKEKFEAESEGKLPILVEDKKRELKGIELEKPTNLLIEGDNYHVLSVLNYTHSKCIDIIYIDPPYNTGNNDFKYNDKFVDSEDSYRHSKWLSFMSKRLKLAKYLLKNTGVIFISIDDNEVAQLKLLCDEIFLEQNFIAIISWQRAYSPKNQSKKISKDIEYILCYAKKSESTDFALLPRTDKMNSRYKNPDKDPRGVWKAGDLVANEERKNGHYIITGPKGDKFDAPKGKHWSYAQNKMLELQKDNRLFFGKDGRAIPSLKQFLSEVQQGRKASTFFVHEEAGHNDEAKKELKDFFEQSEDLFSTPKPTRLIKQLLRFSIVKNPIILDFFSGSGTTAQAVLELNNEDGGKRQFILCTNNENNICTDVCYPRVQKVIQGYKSTKGEIIEGLGSNLKYYKTNFVGSEPTHRNKKILTEKSVEMLCIKENTFEEVFNKKDIFIFKNQEKYSAILFDETKLEEFKTRINNLKLPVSVYVFSLEGDDFSEDFGDLKNDMTLCSIPEAILKVYRRIYETAKPKR